MSDFSDDRSPQESNEHCPNLDGEVIRGIIRSLNMEGLGRRSAYLLTCSLAHGPIA